MKNKKILIGIVMAVVLLIVIVCVGLNSKETKQETKEKLGTLYKFNVEDFNYKLLGKLFYNIKYTGKSNGIGLETSAMFELNSDLTCSYYANVKFNNGDSIRVSQNSCSYVITDDNDLILNADVKNIHYDSANDNVTTTNESMNVNGSFSDDYKYLTIENLKYTNMDYSMLLDKNVNEILFDATAKDLYNIDGIKIVNDEDGEPIKLDLTTFDVKTDTINNVYDGMLSNKFFGIKYVKDIEVNHLDKLLNDNKYSILYISQDGCSYCDDYEEELLKVIPYYQIYINRINTSSISNKEDEEKLNHFIFDKALIKRFGTPATFIIGKGEIKDSFIGAEKNNNIRKFFKDNGFINN